MKLALSPYSCELTLYDSIHETSDNTPGTVYGSENLEAHGARHNPPANSSETIQIVTHILPIHSIDQGKARLNLNEGHCIIRPGQSLPCGLGLTAYSYWHSIALSNSEIKLWTQATVALRQEPDLYRSGDRLNLPWEHLKARSRNFQDRPFHLQQVQETLNIFQVNWSNAMPIIPLSMVYGAIHLTGWGFHFPSPTEQIMWRAACITIIGGIPSLVLLWFIYEALYSRWDTDIFLTPMIVLYLFAVCSLGIIVFWCPPFYHC